MQSNETIERFLDRERPPFNYERQLFNDHFCWVLPALREDTPTPYELEIQPSSKCNLRCEWCCGTALTCGKLPDKLGSEEMRTIAGRVADLSDEEFGIETVKFCGTTGEPLMNPHTAHTISMFKNLGKRVILFTNGVLLDVEDSAGIPNLDYVALGDRLNVSLDCGSEETFQAIKKAKGFGRIVKNLERIVRRKTELGTDLDIRLSYVISTKNQAEIYQTAKLAQRLGLTK